MKEGSGVGGRNVAGQGPEARLHGIKLNIEALHSYIKIFKLGNISTSIIIMRKYVNIFPDGKSNLRDCPFSLYLSSRH